MENHTTAPAVAEPGAKPIRVSWNKGKLVGAKPPLRPSHVWSIRTAVGCTNQGAFGCPFSVNVPVVLNDVAFPVMSSKKLAAGGNRVGR